MENESIACLRETYHKEAMKEASKWVKGETQMMPSFPSISLKETEKISIVARKYKQDRKEFMKTGEWPQGMFLKRDLMWCYYYFLQLTDTSFNLDKYFDFDYDKEEWNRDKLIKAVESYGLNALFHFCVYSSKEREGSFQDYMVERMKVAIKEVESNKELISFVVELPKKEPMPASVVDKREDTDGEIVVDLGPKIDIEELVRRGPKRATVPSFTINVAQRAAAPNTVKQEESRKKARKALCTLNGHQFGQWVERGAVPKGFTRGKNVITVGHTAFSGKRESNSVWMRKCECCGEVETTTRKPTDIEAAEIKNEIKVLQKKLDRIYQRQIELKR